MKKILILLLITSCCLSIMAQPTNNKAQTLDSLASEANLKGDYQSAIKYTKELIELKNADRDSLYLIAILDLANYQENVGEYKKSQANKLKVFELAPEIWGKESYAYGLLLNQLGLMYLQEEDFLRAEQLMNQAARVIKKADAESMLNAAIRNNKALLYKRQKMYRKAEKNFLQVAEIFKNSDEVGEKHYAYIRILQNLGSCYYNMKRYKEAEVILTEVVDLAAEVVGEEDARYGKALNTLAMLYSDKKEYKKAEKLHLKAKGVIKKSIGVANRSYIANLGNLAGVYADFKQYDKSVSLMKEVAQIYKKVLGANSQKYAAALNNLGYTYNNIGDYKKAEEILLQSLAIVQKSNSEIVNLMVYQNLSVAYRETAQFDQAFQILTDAFSLLVEADAFAGIDDIDKLQNYTYISQTDALPLLRALSKVYDKKYTIGGDKEDLKKSYQVAKIAIDLNAKILNEFNTDEDKLTALETTNELATAVITKSYTLQEDSEKRNGFVEQAFLSAEQNRSVLLTSAIKSNRALSLGDLPDSVAIKELKLQKKASQLQTALIQAPTKNEKDSLKSEEKELNIEINHFKQFILDKYPKYHALKYQKNSLSIEAIQEQLDNESLLLEFFVADDQIFVFGIAASTTFLENVAIDKETLNQHVDSFRKALTNYNYILEDEQAAYTQFTKEAYWFYRTFLAKSLKKVKAKKLIIIPDNVLGYIPFEAVLTKKARQNDDYKSLAYLLNDYTINYNYSATLWKDNLQSASQSNNRQLLAMAATYNQKAGLSKLRDRATVNRRKKLLPIPATKDEINKLAEDYKGRFLHAEAANEGFFKQNAKDYSVIHLAMHGLVNQHQPMLSSLAFTEDLDSLEDNFLEAHEIAHLNLNADLLVLSACETGYGKFQQGEGVLSLARSFMYAGVPSLIMSLWQVNDYATAMVMELFYANLARGLHKDEALRQAKLQYIDKAEGASVHPAFWSAFVQLGDNRPVALKTKGIGFMWWALGGGLFLLCIGLLWRWTGNKILGT